MNDYSSQVSRGITERNLRFRQLGLPVRRHNSRANASVKKLTSTDFSIGGTATSRSGRTIKSALNDPEFDYSSNNHAGGGEFLDLSCITCFLVLIVSCMPW